MSFAVASLAPAQTTKTPFVKVPSVCENVSELTLFPVEEDRASKVMVGAVVDGFNESVDSA